MKQHPLLLISLTLNQRIHIHLIIQLTRQRFIVLLLVLLIMMIPNILLRLIGKILMENYLLQNIQNYQQVSSIFKIIQRDVFFLFSNLKFFFFIFKFKFYGALSLIYLVIGIVWMTLSIIHRHDILPVQVLNEFNIIKSTNLIFKFILKF